MNEKQTKKILINVRVLILLFPRKAGWLKHFDIRMWIDFKMMIILNSAFTNLNNIHHVCFRKQLLGCVRAKRVRTLFFI